MQRPLIFAPILIREFRRGMWRRDIFVLRIVPVLAFLAAFLTIARTATTWNGSAAAQMLTPAVQTSLGAATLIATLASQFLITSFLVPPTLGAAIAEEREKDTLAFLLLSRMTAAEIVGQKLTGRLLPILTSVAMSVPLCLFGGWAAGLPPSILFLVVALMFSTPITMGCLSIYASIRQKTNSTAIGLAWAFVSIWLVLPLLARVGLPVPLWLAEIVQSFRAILAVLAESSPISLMVERSWVRDPTHGALAERLQMMLALQFLLAGLTIFGSVANLYSHDKLPIGWRKETTEKNRPVCGDDPIIWREYILPNRLRKLRFLGMMAVQLAALVRMFLVFSLNLLLVALGIFFMLAFWAMIIALYGSAVRYAYFAFREAWWDRGLSANAYTARNAFQGYIQLVSAFFTLITLRMLGDHAKQRITTERDKKTWSTFLTTPLDGSEIVGSKMRASLLNARWLVVHLLILWLLGVVCLAVNPFGALLAAFDLLAVVTFFAAAGIRSALRNSEDVSASSLDLTTTLMLFMHIGIIAFAPGIDLISLGLHISVKWMIAAYAIMSFIAIATAWAAWRAWRECVVRFDEWAGRPRRESLRRAPPEALVG